MIALSDSQATGTRPLTATARNALVAAKVKMFNAVTEFDRKESTKRNYNPYALGQYAAALARVDEYTGDGLSIREAVIRCFVGRLQGVVLKSIGQLPAEQSEQPRQLY